MDEAAWRDAIVRMRREKDRAFRTDPHSPILPAERRGFKGLAYFDPDPRYRFEAALEREPETEVVIPRSAGDEVAYARVGTFTVDVPDGRATFAAFRNAGESGDDELFVPFRDATSGKETYGAGRYLEARHLAGGRYLLDFNLAYHPFCAYNPDYTCPLPPFENWLTIPLRAGERER